MDAATRPHEDGLIEIDGVQHYTVTNVHRMAPFLMSVISDGDRWMFVSSSGALTAGRGDATRALFPYVTDDRLHAAGGATGPITRLRVTDGRAETLWRPFDPRPDAGTRRSVTKSVVGDAVEFEERHDDLGLRLRYRWSSAEEFGFVRTVSLHNDGSGPVRVDVLDGLVDLLPYGLEPALYQRRSNLTNAYKRSELIDSELAVFSLESAVSDGAQPEEVLRATVAWSYGLDGPVSLHREAVASFEAGSPTAAHLVTGSPGAYLARGEFQLQPGQTQTWHIVADVGYDHADVVGLRRTIQEEPDIPQRLVAATRVTTDRLIRVMAPADALQVTADEVACAHHFANVTYNVLRGGVPLAGYLVDTADFVDFVRERHRDVARRHAAWLAELPERLDRRDLLTRISDRVDGTADVHLARLGDEYLPFSFSRRHGDPSRPWNEFSIRVADDAGQPVVYYEGNWRDVFQNWEALCASYPEYLPGVVSMFVNASTADGHNPYRITRAGVDWEVPDPDDPWGNIGYWGDHQIVYLLRLLEASEQYLPGEVGRRLGIRACTYADVPYRIAPYDDLLRDPKATIQFDDDAAAQADARAAVVGGDGKLLIDGEGEIVVATLLEKLLVSALAKLSNFVPGGGIWMNTQRPEWNDANNALAGNGLSVVTLFHLRRYLVHLRSLVVEARGEFEIAAEVTSWFDAVAAVLADAPEPTGEETDKHRRKVTDRLGRAASEYRSGIYRAGFSGETSVIQPEVIVDFCDVAVGHLDATISVSWREDGLAHSYNIVGHPTDVTTTVTRLPLMLEGQVAALSAGVMSAEEQADLLDAVFASALYRADQRSFLLTPARALPAFLDKNVIPDVDVAGNALLSALVSAGHRSVIRVDSDGTHRFAPEVTSEDALVSILDDIGETSSWGQLVAQHRRATLDVYEAVFDHRSYLGRSGSMYAYEGIGSIYWHMVTKLLLAVHDAIVDAAGPSADRLAIERLTDGYERVRSGLGFNKSPQEFGAIPIDPYSHTPAHAGAQQPGMTGAVKEELLARRGELGVQVVDGEITFDAVLLRTGELLGRPRRWVMTSLGESEVAIDVPDGALGLTVCHVPIVVSVSSDEQHVEVEFADGRTVRHDGRRLGRAPSASIFGRTGEIAQVRAVVRVA